MDKLVYSIKTGKPYEQDYKTIKIDYKELLDLDNIISDMLKKEAEARAREEETKRKLGEERKNRAEAARNRRVEEARVKDPYSILGVSRNASISDVQRAYFSLARRYHPDLFQDPREKSAAEERMKTINVARDSLFALLGGKNVSA